MTFYLLTGCPLQGKTVDIPPSISVSTIGLQVGITGCSRKGAGLLAHGVRNGASLDCLTHWRDWHLPNMDVMGITYIA
jgi:hypothetical protein